MRPPATGTAASPTLRPLTDGEVKQAAGGILIALLLPAVQKVR